MISISAEGNFLDIREGEDKRFFINKSLHNLRDMFGRNSDRSRSIVLPRSPNNINILAQHSARIGDDYRALSCQVFMSGVPVLENAQLVIIGEDDNHFEATILGGAATFYNLIPEASIQDLNYETDNFEWTLANYVARRNNSSNLVTAWAQWMTNESYRRYKQEGDPLEEVEAVDIDKAGFCYYAKDILAKIFENIPLEIDSSLVENEDYNSMTVVCTMPQMFEGFLDLGADRGEVGIVTSLIIPAGQAGRIEFDLVVINTGNVWDAILFQYEPNEREELSISALLIRTGSAVPEVTLIKMAGGVDRVPLAIINWSGFNGRLDVVDVGEPGDVYFLEYKSVQVNISYVNGSFFKFHPLRSFDRNIEVSEFLPDITQREFAKNIFNLFHIVVADISGRITLSHFEDIIDNPQVNLSARIASDRQIKYTPRLQDYGQDNHFKYAEEPLVISDAFNEIIQINNNSLPPIAIKIELFFAGMDGTLFDLPGHTVPMFEVFYGSEDNNNIQIQGTLGTFATYSTVDGNPLRANDVIFVPEGGGFDRFVVRRVFDSTNGELDYQLAINKIDQDWSWLSYERLEPKFQLSRVRFDNTHTYIYHQGSERQQETDTLYTDLLTWDIMLEQYYPSYKDMIRNFQVLSLWVDIPNTIFLELNSLAPIYLLGNTYYLNKTEQYKENGLVRLELLRFN